MFNASTILGFIVGKLYHPTNTATEEFGPLVEALTGWTPSTASLPTHRANLAEKLKSCLPQELQEVINSWKHTDDWERQCKELNKKFPNIIIINPDKKSLEHAKLWY